MFLYIALSIVVILLTLFLHYSQHFQVFEITKPPPNTEKLPNQSPADATDNGQINKFPKIWPQYV